MKDPSESLPVKDQLYDLLRDEIMRDMYRKCLNSCRNFHHSDAKAWFLQKLIDTKLIPSFYRIKNTSIDPNDRALQQPGRAHPRPPPGASPCQDQGKGSWVSK